MCSTATTDDVEVYSSPFKKLRSSNISFSSPTNSDDVADFPTDNAEQSLLDSANAGLQKYKHLTLTTDGTGGAYIVKAVSGRSIGIYKPSVEEAFGPENPRGYVSQQGGGIGAASPLRPGFRVGRGFVRERAVYLLDKHSLLQAGVPTTVVVKSNQTRCGSRKRSGSSSSAGSSASGSSTFAALLSPTSSNHGMSTATTMPSSATTTTPLRLTPVPSINAVVSNNVWLNGRFGSLQQFQPSVGTMEDYGTKGLDVLQAQLIACLDIRTMNQDRHGANLLVTGSRGLVPIDHGFSLPSYTNLSKTTFYWSSWPQIRQQLPHSQVLALVQSLDSAKDAQLLRACGIDETSILSMRIGTELLKVGCQQGLSLGAIADLCLRSDPETTALSDIEQLVQEAVVAVADASSTASGGPKSTSGSGSAASVICTFGAPQAGPTCNCQHCQIFDALNVAAVLPNDAV